MPSEYKVSHESVIGVASSLAAEFMIIMKSKKTSSFQLSAEGSETIEEGSQEARCFSALREAGEAGLDKKSLEEKVGKDIAKVGIGNCMKNKVRFFLFLFFSFL